MGRLYTAFKNLCRRGYAAIYHDFERGRECSCIEDAVGCFDETVVPLIHVLSVSADGQIHLMGVGGGYRGYAILVSLGGRAARPYILIYGEKEALEYVPCGPSCPGSMLARERRFAAMSRILEELVSTPIGGSPVYFT